MTRKEREEKTTYIEKRRADFCLRHCPFPNAKECAQCYDSQKPLSFRALVAEKATDAGYADDDVIAMFRLRPRARRKQGGSN